MKLLRFASLNILKNSQSLNTLTSKKHEDKISLAEYSILYLTSCSMVEKSCENYDRAEELIEVLILFDAMMMDKDQKTKVHKFAKI